MLNVAKWHCGIVAFFGFSQKTTLDGTTVQNQRLHPFRWVEARLLIIGSKPSNEWKHQKGTIRYQ